MGKKGYNLYIRSIIFCCLSVVLPLAVLADDAQRVSRTTEERGVSDPLETVNRGIFWFNNQLDMYLLEPIAKVYDAVVPDIVQLGVNNFFSNLHYPVNLLNDIAQLKFDNAGKDTVRFVVNTSIGLGGLVDVASDGLGLDGKYQDFGTTLGHWGLGSGIYIMLPIIGPSCSRDSVGRLFDAVTHPLFYLNFVDMKNADRNAITFSARGLELIQTRADLLDVLKTGKEASFDYYSFVRSSYLQRRAGLIRGEVGFEEEDFPPPAN